MRDIFWKTRLKDALHESRAVPFSWGQHDCIMFASHCIEAMTGIDPAADFRGRYKTAHGAKRILRSLGFKTPADAFASIFEEINPSDCRLGDVVSYPAPLTGSSLAIVLDHRAVGPAEMGMSFVPVEAATRGFRIPE